MPSFSPPRSPRSAAQAEIKTEWIEYSHGDVKLKGYLAYDDAITGKRPAVLVIHAREGMTANTMKNVEMYAKFGYVGFAADIFGYGQGVLPKDVPEMQAQTTIYNKDRALMKARTQAGYDVLAKHPLVDAVEDRAGRLLLRRHAPPSSSARPACRSRPRSRSTARSTTIRPDGRRASRARC